MQELFERSPSSRDRFSHHASRRLPSTYLSSMPLFRSVDPEGLRELDLESNWVRLPAGRVLFEQGDAPDYLYVLVRGRLEVSVERRFARRIGAEIGSEIEFDVQGVPLTLHVTSVRTVVWQSLALNFFLVAEPGALDDAPALHLVSARVPPESDSAR